MLKGHTFSKQLFENHMFALFVNTFLDGANGIPENYKDGMPITFSGSNVTIGPGAIIIQGRILEEKTSTTLAAGTTELFCKLVIEIDLDQTNTISELNQASYKIITGVSDYPTLTQTDIVNNVSGKYQYELARFKTTANGITDFVDKRKFLDIEGLYEALQNQYAESIGVLSNLKTNEKNSLVGAINEIFDKMYPIGCIYMSATNVNPSQLFGGTWVSWGAGRVPVGIDTSDQDFNTAGKTGGAKTVALSINNMPAHNHAYNAANSATGSTKLTLDQIPAHRHSIDIDSFLHLDWQTDEVNGGHISPYTDQEGTVFNTRKAGGGSGGTANGHTHTISTGSANTTTKGSGTAHNNLQPYIVCYMFKRTA